MFSQKGDFPPKLRSDAGQKRPIPPGIRPPRRSETATKWEANWNGTRPPRGPGPTLVYDARAP